MNKRTRPPGNETDAIRAGLLRMGPTELEELAKMRRWLQRQPAAEREYIFELIHCYHRRTWNAPYLGALALMKHERRMVVLLSAILNRKPKVRAAALLRERKKRLAKLGLSILPGSKPTTE